MCNLLPWFGTASKKSNKLKRNKAPKQINISKKHLIWTMRAHFSDNFEGLQMEWVSDLGLSSKSLSLSQSSGNEPRNTKRGKILLLSSPAAAVWIYCCSFWMFGGRSLSWIGWGVLDCGIRIGKLEGESYDDRFRWHYCSTPLLEIISEWLGLVLNP